MKKVFLAFAVAAMMVSCFSNEVVNNLESTRIDFASHVAGNSTRADENPSFTTANIAAFDVWAFMDKPSGQVFDQERVKKNKKKQTTTYMMTIEKDVEDDDIKNIVYPFFKSREEDTAELKDPLKAPKQIPIKYECSINN